MLVGVCLKQRLQDVRVQWGELMAVSVGMVNVSNVRALADRPGVRVTVMVRAICSRGRVLRCDRE